MDLERWQLCRHYENDHRRRVATKRISQPHATNGRRATYSRPGIGSRSVRVEPEPSGDVAQSKLIANSISHRLLIFSLTQTGKVKSLLWVHFRIPETGSLRVKNPHNIEM